VTGRCIGTVQSPVLPDFPYEKTIIVELLQFAIIPGGDSGGSGVETAAAKNTAGFQHQKRLNPEIVGGYGM